MSTSARGSGTLRTLRIDPFIIGLLIAAALGFAVPARGMAATAVDVLKAIAIGLLFFLQGVRLQREAIIAGMTNWRLQSLTLASTFLVFPLLGMLLHAVIPGLLDESLWFGVLFLCALPSTVQSSIAFTSIARGNVPAAICAATASNLLGIVLTPVLVTLLLNMHASASPATQIQAIVQQLLLPFIAGQMLSRWLRAWALRHPVLVSITDRGSILLVVYAAFSAAVLDYNRGNYALAADSLEVFIKSHPGSARKPDALFFLGLAHFNQKSYEKAQGVFEQLIRESPSSNQFLPAKLKRAQCLSRQNLKPAAVRAFKELVEGFSGTPEARTAQQELADLGF